MPKNREIRDRAQCAQDCVAHQSVFRGNRFSPSGDPDLHIVDGYQVSCGETKRMVYMDMYHCKQASPTKVPAGFGKED